MPWIREQVYIRATPEEVYAVIADVENYHRYSSAIERIQPIAPQRYRWQVRLLGLPLHWDADVISATPGRRFAWRSLSGLENRGEFRLAQVANGTRVNFSMEYRLPFTLLNLLANGLESPLVSLFRYQLLNNVKRRLETKRPALD